MRALIVDLQEQAEFFGFGTIQEALDNGFKVVDNKLVRG